MTEFFFFGELSFKTIQVILKIILIQQNIFLWKQVLIYNFERKKSKEYLDFKNKLRQ